jgi:hypothetical protein
MNHNLVVNKRLFQKKNNDDIKSKLIVTNSIVVVNFSKNLNIKQRNPHGKPCDISIKRNGNKKLHTNISLIKKVKINLSNIDVDERTDGNNGG